MWEVRRFGWINWKASAAHLLWDSASLTSVPLQTKAAWPGRQAGPGPLLFLAWLLGAGTDDRFFLPFSDGVAIHLHLSLYLSILFLRSMVTAGCR